MALRSDDETLHWLALHLTPGLGARKTLDLLAAYRTPQAIFRASASELAGQGVPGAVARSIASGCLFEDAASQHERMAREGVTLLTVHDAAYPELLRQIFDPPVVLFARGRIEILGRVGVAIVGSRLASTYGKAVAERLATDLAARGVTVVSGMARGIDTAAHLGALAAQGPTLAVYGCGVDVVYPRENRSLAARLGAQGLILSEFPMGSPAYPQNFPIRNRVVSGLSAGVVVVEGTQYSGSAITARLALEQNREVFAVPGNITAQQSFGPNLLIKQGAQLVQSASDILDGLPWECRKQIAAQSSGPPPAAEQAALDFGPMTGVAQQVLRVLKVDTALNLDDITELCPDASSSEVIAMLFELELAGLVRQLPGKSFVKVMGR
ncbi:MAG: DNA-processing protein DprA [Bryobacteraceae bacterium]|nr:DNA-processing protein DprA [Bryobacteraceae bacterium]